MQSGKINSIKEEKKQTPPPLLMDLTDVSRIANQKFGNTAFRTLEIIQEVLKERFPNLAANGDKSLINEKNSRIVNPAKVVDHHALYQKQ